MIKVILPSSFNFDGPTMSLVDVHSRGVDSAWLRKSAAVLTKELSEIRPEPGVTFTHLLALGDLETFGYNRNGDGFPKQACIDHHHTFVKNAKWYHNHKNKPHLGDPHFGFVKHSAYNPEMHRVELIVGIYNDKDPDSIEKLARGEDLPVSMACSVPHDICNICQNKAKTRKEYCDHITKYATQILDDGRQVGMINERPSFFDISKVHRNADRIAFTLRKVASADSVMLGADMAQLLNIAPPEWLVKNSAYSRKLSLLHKLATIEKEISGVIKGNPAMQCAAEGMNEPCSSMPSVDDGKMRQVMTALSNARVSLPIEDFLRLVTGGRFSEIEDLVPEAKAALPGVFSDSLSCPDELLSGGEAYEPLDLSVPNSINSIVKSIGGPSLHEGPLNGKIIAVTLRKKAGSYMAGEKRGKLTKAGQELAKEYARYKLALLDKVDNESASRLSVLQNFG